MKTTSKLSRVFKFFWLSAKEANPIWDTLLNKLIDEGNVTKIDRDGYYIEFDDKYTVWTANHPYASGNLYQNKVGIESQPHCYKRTKIKLEDFANSLQSKDDQIMVSKLAEFESKSQVSLD